MTEHKRERYAHHPDMDRTTAGERIPIGIPPADVPWREKIADGVYRGVNDSFVHLPPRPRRPSHFEQRMAEIAAYRERQRRRHVIGWTVFLLGVVPVVGALLMVAVTHG